MLQERKKRKEGRSRGPAQAHPRRRGRAVRRQGRERLDSAQDCGLVRPAPVCRDSDTGGGTGNDQ